MWESNQINKVLLKNEEEYIDLVLSLRNKFPSTEAFENHFELEPYNEETHPEEFENGEIRIDTMKFKPERYPCLYVVMPLMIDEMRGFGGAGGWFDEFIYSSDLE